MYVSSMRGGQFTVRFQPVKLRAQRRVPCTVCGKKIQRSATFEQTINPFNTNTQGDVKSYTEIMEELGAEAAAWQPVATHRACEATEE